MVSKMKNHQAGFTMLEVLLSLAVIALIGGIGVPVYNSFQNRNSLDVAVSTYASSVRRAQVLSQGMSGDSPWGVRINVGDITLFKGANFAARDTAFDEIFKIPTSISFVGQQEIIMAKMSGLPSSTGSLTLTSANNESRTLLVNAKGMVQY